MQLSQQRCEIGLRAMLVLREELPEGCGSAARVDGLFHGQGPNRRHVVLGKPAGYGHLPCRGSFLTNPRDTDHNFARQPPQVVLGESDGLCPGRRQPYGSGDLLQGGE
ncbi:hypothetical protein STREPTOSP366_19120 [Streptomyces variabilis]